MLLDVALDRGAQIGSLIDVNVVAAAARVAFEEDGRLVDTVDDAIGRHAAARQPGEGWQQVRYVSRKEPHSFAVGNPKVVWGNTSNQRIFLWRNMFLNGIPRDGTIYLACGGRYKLFLNEKLLASDTSSERSITKVDSITGVTSLMKGGDNIFAMEIHTVNLNQQIQ